MAVSLGTAGLAQFAIISTPAVSIYLYFPGGPRSQKSVKPKMQQEMKQDQRTVKNENSRLLVCGSKQELTLYCGKSGHGS